MCSVRYSIGLISAVPLTVNTARSRLHALVHMYVYVGASVTRTDVEVIVC